MRYATSICILFSQLALAADPWTVKDCENSAGALDGAALVCVDLADAPRTLKAPPILKPNTGLVVAIRSDYPPVVELSGSRGVTVPKLQILAPHALGAPPEPTISVTRFAPRQAGKADLSIKKLADAGLVEVTKVELEVEQRFWGAVRFGLSAVFGDFRSYDAKTFAGSQVAQIGEQRSPVQFEFVVGFAPYIEAFWGGRSYGGGLRNPVAPFIGFGLLGQSANGLDALTSFHGGLEIEFARDFSIALTFVVRRSRVLAVGYDVGSPVQVATVPEQFTSTGATYGGAITINATPAFLQFVLGDAQETR